MDMCAGCGGLLLGPVLKGMLAGSLFLISGRLHVVKGGKRGGGADMEHLLVIQIVLIPIPAHQSPHEVYTCGHHPVSLCEREKVVSEW